MFSSLVKQFFIAVKKTTHIQGNGRFSNLFGEFYIFSLHFGVLQLADERTQCVPLASDAASLF